MGKVSQALTGTDGSDWTDCKAKHIIGSNRRGQHKTNNTVETNLNGGRRAPTCLGLHGLSGWMGGREGK